MQDDQPAWRPELLVIDDVSYLLSFEANTNSTMFYAPASKPTPAQPDGL
jgi:hypothetical protein